MLSCRNLVVTALMLGLAALLLVGCGGGGGGGLPTTGTVVGQVLMSGSSDPLGGITVSIGGQTAVTDSQGGFSISKVPPGNQTLTVSPDPSRHLVWPPSTPFPVISVVAGQTTTLPAPLRMIDDSDLPPAPPGG